MIKDLSSKEKLQWAITAKENANVLFKQKQFHDAIKIYVECLAAADFGSDIKSCENLDTLVVPVVCNLGTHLFDSFQYFVCSVASLILISLCAAACSIELKEWRKVVSFCDQALDFRPRCAKALYRKSVALLELGDYDGALAALHCMDIQPNQEVGYKSGGSDVSMPLSEQEASKVPGLLVRARNGIRRQKEHAQRQKQALVRAFNKSSLRSEPDGPHSSDEDLHKQAPAVIEKETMKMMTAWELFSYFLRSFIYFVSRFFSPTKRLNKES